MKNIASFFLKPFAVVDAVSGDSRAQLLLLAADQLFHQMSMATQLL
jgi:hypothetical protein